MPYVPPHLRGKGDSAASGGPPATGGGQPSGDRPGSGGRGYDSRRAGPDDRRGGYDDRRGGDGGGRGYGGGYGGGGGGGDRPRSGYGGRGFDERPRSGYGGGRRDDRAGMPDGRGDPRDVKPPGDAPAAGEAADPADAGAAEAVNGAGAAPGQPERQTKTSGSAKSNWKPTQRVLDMTSEMIDEIRQRLNVHVENGDNEETGVRCAPIESFHDMNLHRDIQADIRSHEYEAPTPIQSQAMPVALSGRDILGCAETGSGKTAAFSIPMIQYCLQAARIRRGDGPIGLVLAPTRELAQQIDKEVRAFSVTSIKSVKTCIVVGGSSMSEQRGDLRSGVEIIVATPGRFIDHLQQGNTSLNRVSYVVLDEADRMLDMGFEPQIRDVMRSLAPGHQTLLFSATMPEEIEKLANDYLHSPVRIKVGKVSTPTANVSQHLQKTTNDQKLEDVMTHLLEEQQAAENNNNMMPLTIVFVERKAKCDEVASALKMANLKAAALHGGLGQHEREGALRDFTKGHIRILVATDVASRGLDIKGIALVVNMDLPRSFEDYVHRIGRTGRAGVQGRSTSFYTDRDSFIVSQIRQALSALEAGNTFAFATGKAARQKEKELAAQFREGLKTGSSNVVETGGGATLKVDDKYKFMANTTTSNAGAADDAWSD